MDIYLRLMNLPDGCEMRHLNGKKIKVWHYNLHPSSRQLSINGYDNYCPMCFEGKMLSIKLGRYNYITINKDITEKPKPMISRTRYPDKFRNLKINTTQIYEIDFHRIVKIDAFIKDNYTTIYNSYFS